jgi:ketosteroid isomerase-like protein
VLDDQFRSALQGLLDKQEIHEILMRYCRAIDRCDEELLRSVYHPDAVDNHGSQNGRASEFVPWAIKALERDELTTHFIANELIEVRGDLAYGESYFIGVHRRKQKDGTTVDLTFAGRYVDRFERRQGVWKIAHRQVVNDWNRVDPVGQTFSMGRSMVGRRSREDAVYKR